MKRSSPIPSARASSISSVESIVNDDMPSICTGSTPQSAIAARSASQPSWSSERFEFFEYSVSPMPTIAASSFRVVGMGSSASYFGSSTTTLPVTWLPHALAPLTSTSAVPAAASSAFTALRRALVVVHRREVARRERGRDDQARGQRDVETGQLVADLQLREANALDHAILRNTGSR